MLSPDRIRPFILDEDPDVRRSAINYFAKSWSDDPDVLPMVLDAFERFGPRVEGGVSLYDAAQLVITAPTLDRVLGLLATTEDEGAVRDLNRIVAAAPAGLLRERAGAIAEHSKIPPEFRRRLDARREYLDWPAERLYADLEAFARRAEEAESIQDVDFDYAADLVDALGDRDVPDDETLVRRIVELEPEEGWLEVFLVDLAGRRRLRAAVPALVNKFQIDADFLLDRASDALARIGDVEAVRLIRREFRGAPDPFPSYAPGVLGAIKHPESEEAVLELLDGEDDEWTRTWLCAALCDLFSEEGFEAVRAEMKSGPVTTFRELCTPALSLMKVTGLEPPPEAKVWEEERRRQHEGIARALAEFDDWGPALLGGGPPDDEPFDDEPRRDVETIRKVGPKVGRNDPCPCGSGKKFKKCCGRSG